MSSLLTGLFGGPGEVVDLEGFVDLRCLGIQLVGCGVLKAGTDVGVAGAFEYGPQDVVVPVSELDSVQVGGLVDVGCDFLGQDPGPGGFQGGGVEVVEADLWARCRPLLLSGAPRSCSSLHSARTAVPQGPETTARSSGLERARRSYRTRRT